MLDPAPSTRDKILQEATAMLAHEGADGTSMRRLADRVGVKQPIIYYYFGSKEKLLEAVFRTSGMQLGMAVAALSPAKTTSELLRQRILFHLQQAPLIMAILNYFLLDKRHAGKLRIPPQAYRHIQEVIDQGVAEGIYDSQNSARDAGIVVHALNGFTMEHFPRLANQQDRQLVEDLAVFIERSLRRTP